MPFAIAYKPSAVEFGSDPGDPRAYPPGRDRSLAYGTTSNRRSAPGDKWRGNAHRRHSGLVTRAARGPDGRGLTPNLSAIRLVVSSLDEIARFASSVIARNGVPNMKRIEFLEILCPRYEEDFIVEAVKRLLEYVW